MPSHFEDQPWYSEWKKTTDRVIAALMARDSTKQGTGKEKHLTVNMRRPSPPSGCWLNSTDDRPIFGRKRVPINKTKCRATPDGASALSDPQGSSTEHGR